VRSLRSVCPPLVAALLTASPSARGAPSPDADLHFRADHAEADPRLGDVTLDGHVVLSYGRFRVDADRLTLHFARDRVAVDGTGRLAPCPCDRPPVTIGFSGARTFGRGDLLVRFPRLLVGPVPIFALPVLWLRAPDRPGLLPPVFALRGADGLIVGEGVRLPWRGAGGAQSALELRAAGYFQGGVELSARLDTPSSTARLVWDHLRKDRVVADAHGSLRPARPHELALAWDLDALRGPRALRATVSLAQAARPFDTGTVEASMRLGSGGDLGALLATGLLARARRGQGPLLFGPLATLAASGSLGPHGTWDASAFGAALAGPGAAHPGATPVGRAAVGLEQDLRPGPFDLRLAARGRARVAAPADISSVAWDAVAEVRVEARLPLVRVLAEPMPGEAPLVHWIAPVVEARAALARGAGAFFEASRPAAPPLHGLATAGVFTALGRAYGGALRLDARAGLLGKTGGALPVAWARLDASVEIAAARAEITTVGTPSNPGPDTGLAALAEIRAGRAVGPMLAADMAVRAGSGGALARAVAPSPTPIGDALGLLADRGLTFGAEARAPLPMDLFVRARADVDPRASALLGVSATLSYRHPGGCGSIELGGARRVGRPGVDVWLALDLVPPLPPATPRGK
jgi:hypothetical protein